MNPHRTSLFTLITLITLVITPAAVAEVYKCDGPDGPIYSDKKCGSDATNVELTESSGMTGMSEQEKINVAEKKQEREQAKIQNQKDNAVNNQNDAHPTESPRVWVNDQNHIGDRVNAYTLPAKPPSAKPPPVTLPAKPPPAGPRKKDG